MLEYSIQTIGKEELKKGIEILVGSRTPELTLAENPLMDDKVTTPLKSNDSLKQEVKTNFY